MPASAAFVHFLQFFSADSSLVRKPFDRLPKSTSAIEKIAALTIGVMTCVRRRAPSVRQITKNEIEAVFLFI